MPICGTWGGEEVKGREGGREVTRVENEGIWIKKIVAFSFNLLMPRGQALGWRRSSNEKQVTYLIYPSSPLIHLTKP